MQTAHGKLILFGEHAVVYKQPAIAIPFTAVSATAEAVASPAGSGLMINAHDIKQEFHILPDDDLTDNDMEDNPLIFAALLTLNKLGKKGDPPPDLTINIRSTIPIASGMGSGAAVSAALIRELSTAMGLTVETDKLNDMVYEVEKLHHGTPSGIDNAVVVRGQPIYFVKGEKPEAFTVGKKLTFLVADSGSGVPTRETVGAVRQLFEKDPEATQKHFERIGEIVREARTFLSQGDSSGLGELMDSNQSVLKALTVSSPRLDTLTQTARDMGALGAKL